MIRPKKHLGQHFLRDENIAQKIIGCLNPEYTTVLEVGPGMGVLTKYLLELKNSAKTDPWFMEVDSEAVAYLYQHFPGISDRLIQGDFLKYDLSGFPPAQSPSPEEIAENRVVRPKFTLIGNFPYNISSQILFTALANRDRIPEIIGMFQKEVAERIASPPGSKAYGIISVLLQAFYNIEYLFTVSESVFYPPPKVKSAVIRLRRNSVEKLPCDEALFIRLVKTAFNQRRKTLRNSIRSMLPISATPHGSPVLSACLDLRAERLSVDDFVRLATEISCMDKGTSIKTSPTASD